MTRNHLLPRLLLVWALLPLLPGCAGNGMDGMTPAGGKRERHQAAAERIESLGGRVVIGDPGTSVTFFQVPPGAIADALPLVSRLLQPESITIVPTGGRASGGAIELADLGDLPELRHVLIRGMKLSNADLQYLTDRPELRDLHLIDTDLTDKQLSRMATETRLDRLTLVDQPVTDQGLVNLKRMRSLLHLRLVGTQATAATARELTETLPRLTVELDGETFRGEYAPE